MAAKTHFIHFCSISIDILEVFYKSCFFFSRVQWVTKTLFCSSPSNLQTNRRPPVKHLLTPCIKLFKIITNKKNALLESCWNAETGSGECEQHVCHKIHHHKTPRLLFPHLKVFSRTITLKSRPSARPLLHPLAHLVPSARPCLSPILVLVGGPLPHAGCDLCRRGVVAAEHLLQQGPLGRCRHVHEGVEQRQEQQSQ